MKKLLIIFIIGILSICTSTISSAFWSQTFNESGIGPFNQLGIWWIANDEFEDPAFSSFNVSDWWNFNFSDTNAYAFGPATTNMNFNINFEGDKSDGTDFLYMASEGLTFKRRLHIIYDGGWNESDASGNWYELGGGNPIDPALIPEPASMILFGMGALGMGVIRKRR